MKINYLQYAKAQNRLRVVLAEMMPFMCKWPEEWNSSQSEQYSLLWNRKDRYYTDTDYMAQIDNILEAMLDAGVRDEDVSTLIPSDVGDANLCCVFWSMSEKQFFKGIKIVPMGQVLPL